MGIDANQTEYVHCNRLVISWTAHDHRASNALHQLMKSCPPSLTDCTQQGTAYAMCCLLVVVESRVQGCLHSPTAHCYSPVRETNIAMIQQLQCMCSTHGRSLTKRTASSCSYASKLTTKSPVSETPFTVASYHSPSPLYTACLTFAVRATDILPSRYVGLLHYNAHGCTMEVSDVGRTGTLAQLIRSHEAGIFFSKHCRTSCDLLGYFRKETAGLGCLLKMMGQVMSCGWCPTERRGEGGHRYRQMLQLAQQSAAASPRLCTLQANFSIACVSQVLPFSKI